MQTAALSLTYRIDLDPGERLRLPDELVDSIGEGSWIVTVSPANDGTPLRDHSSFLRSYSAEDDGLYAGPAAG